MLTDAQKNEARNANLTNDEAARRLREVADKLRRDAETWTHPSAASVKEMLKNDANAMDLAADDIEAGRLEAAYAYASTWETAAREEIPAAVWVHIGGELL